RGDQRVEGCLEERAQSSGRHKGTSLQVVAEGTGARRIVSAGNAERARRRVLDELAQRPDLGQETSEVVQRIDRWVGRRRSTQSFQLNVLLIELRADRGKLRVEQLRPNVLECDLERREVVIRRDIGRIGPQLEGLQQVGLCAARVVGDDGVTELHLWA